MEQAARSTPKRAGGRRPMTIGDFADAVLRHCGETASSKDSLLAKRRVFQILAGLGLQSSADLEVDETVRRFQAAMPSVWSASYRRSLQAHLNRLLRLGLELGLLRSLPELPRLNSRKLPRVAPILLPSPDAVRALFDQLRDNADTWEGRRLYYLVSTIVLSGIRLREAIRMRIDDIDLAGGMMWIQRRAGSHSNLSRIPIRIMPNLRPILADLAEWSKSQWAFPGVKGEASWPIWGRSDPLSCLKAAARKAGIPGGLTFEQLRQFHLEHAVTSIDLGLSIIPTRQESATSAAEAVPAISIGGPNDPVVVQGKPKRSLTRRQYQAISFLLDAWPGGLTMRQMTVKCGSDSWRPTLARLKKIDSDYDSAILFAGRSHRVYRIGSSGRSG